MFGLGTPELLVIVILVVILFGAGGAAAAARALGQSRKQLQELADEIQAPIKEVVAEVKDTTSLDAAPLQVFVSSVMDPKREDLIAERAAAKNAIQEIRLTRAWRFEDSPASPASARWVYLKKVEECDIFVLVLGKEATRPVMREYWRARKNKKPRLVFLKEGERTSEAQSFLNIIRNEVTYKEFKSAEDLNVETWRAIGTLLINAFRDKLSKNDIFIITALLEQLPKPRSAEPHIEVHEPEMPRDEKQAELPSVKIGRDGKRMILIPAGWFLMGTSEADIMEMQIEFRWNREWFTNETPQHRVYLDGYYIGETPVTNAEYKRFLATNPRHPLPFGWDETWRTFPAGEGDYPVSGVSWEGADAYARWVGGRLPTEAQWEKAARGTDGRRYPWGNQGPDGTRCNFNQMVRHTTSVGKYAPRGNSPYGVWDMAGNVWEWCEDWFESAYYQRSPTHNPDGPSTGKVRVVRGGSFGSEGRGVRCAYRSWYLPVSFNLYRGIRVVLSPVRL